MGRLGLRSTTVGQTAQHLLETRRITQPPIWLPVIARHPPGEITHRPLPANPPQASKRSTFKQKNKRLFHPQPMRYLEDDLRTAFFGDHPWELARPRQVLEQDGRNGRDCDWSRMRQKTVRLSGESVIQRQLYLMRQRRPLDPSLPSSPSVPLHTVQEAYDIARKEFYELRLEEDIERRIAKEEALHVGAYFGPTHLEVGMQLENQAYEDWRAWANREYELKAHSRAAQYTGEGSEEGDAGELVPVEE